MNQENKTIREIIIDKRKMINLTQVDLANKTGLTQAQISNFESGKTTLGSDNLDKIFDVLNLKNKQTKEEQWKLAGICANNIKSKKIKNVDSISKEEMAEIAGDEDILLLQVLGEKVYDQWVLSRVVDEHNTYNYFLTLVKFRLACLK